MKSLFFLYFVHICCDLYLFSFFVCVCLVTTFDSMMSTDVCLHISDMNINR